MIALKLALQSLAGVVAVCGAIGGTVALSKNKNYEPNFLLVYVNKAIHTDEKAKQPLWDKESKNKNYECSIANVKDESCEIYKLPFETNLKRIELKKIKDSIKNEKELSEDKTKKPQASDLKYRSFFILKLSSQVSLKAISERTESVMLSSKSEKDKHFSSLSFAHNLSDDAQIPYTNMSIAKVVDQTPSKTINKKEIYSCKLKDKIATKISDCSILSLPNFPSQKDIKSVSHKTFATGEELTIQKEAHFFIQFLDFYYSLSDLFETTIEVSETKTTQKIFDLKIEAPIFAKISLDQPIGETIFIN